MTTLMTADGRLLRAQRPNGAGYAQTGAYGGFRPMWSDGTSDNVDPDAYLKSYEAIYRSQPVLRSVIDKLARRIATLPLLAYQKKGKKRVATEGDSLDTLLKRPMPRHSTVHLVAHIAQSLLLHGNAVVAKGRTHGNPDLPPDMLWPLNWAQISAYGPEGGTIEWWSTSQFEGVERFLEVNDAVHFAWPSPSGSEIGVSPLESLGVTLRLEDAAQRHQTSQFRNGVRPSAFVSLDDPNPKREKLELASATIRAAHGGMDKSGSWVFGGANTKITPLSFNAVEVELIQQRRLDREEIGMVYDMAGPLMGDLEHATFSNVTEMLRSLYRDVIPPWTELIVQTAQAQLIDPEGSWLNRYIRFSFDDKLKGAPEEQAAVDKSDVEAGIRTRDEARDGRGLEAKGGVADELTANTNNQNIIGSLDPEDDPARNKLLVEAATALFRAGFDPQDALRAVGLDPIKHGGLLPITLKSEADMNDVGDIDVRKASSPGV